VNILTHKISKPLKRFFFIDPQRRKVASANWKFYVSEGAGIAALASIIKEKIFVKREI
jgi:hypothetical protein